MLSILRADESGRSAGYKELLLTVQSRNQVVNHMSLRYRMLEALVEMGSGMVPDHRAYRLPSALRVILAALSYQDTKSFKCYECIQLGN
jgi:hypothetical protein